MSSSDETLPSRSSNVFVRPPVNVRPRTKRRMLSPFDLKDFATGADQRVMEEEYPISDVSVERSPQKKVEGNVFKRPRMLMQTKRRLDPINQDAFFDDADRMAAEFDDAGEITNSSDENAKSNAPSKQTNRNQNRTRRRGKRALIPFDQNSFTAATDELAKQIAGPSQAKRSPGNSSVSVAGVLSRRSSKRISSQHGTPVTTPQSSKKSATFDKSKEDTSKSIRRSSRLSINAVVERLHKSRTEIAEDSEQIAEDSEQIAEDSEQSARLRSGRRGGQPGGIGNSSPQRKSPRFVVKGTASPSSIKSNRGGASPLSPRDNRANLSNVARTPSAGDRSKGSNAAATSVRRTPLSASTKSTKRGAPSNPPSLLTRSRVEGAKDTRSTTSGSFTTAGRPSPRASRSGSSFRQTPFVGNTSTRLTTSVGRTASRRNTSQLESAKYASSSSSPESDRSRFDRPSPRVGKIGSSSHRTPPTGGGDSSKRLASSVVKTPQDVSLTKSDHSKRSPKTVDNAHAASATKSPATVLGGPKAATPKIFGTVGVEETGSRYSQSRKSGSKATAAVNVDSSTVLRSPKPVASAAKAGNTTAPVVDSSSTSNMKIHPVRRSLFSQLLSPVEMLPPHVRSGVVKRDSSTPKVGHNRPPIGDIYVADSRGDDEQPENDSDHSSVSTVELVEPLLKKSGDRTNLESSKVSVSHKRSDVAADQSVTTVAYSSPRAVQTRSPSAKQNEKSGSSSKGTLKQQTLPSSWVQSGKKTKMDTSKSRRSVTEIPDPDDEDGIVSDEFLGFPKMTQKSVLGQLSVSKRATTGPRSRSRLTFSKHDKTKDILPIAYTRSNFQHFIQRHVSRDVALQMHKHCNDYMSDTIRDAAEIANAQGSDTITKKHLLRALTNQGMINDEETMEDLIREFMPLEYRAQVIPCAQSGNVVIPNKSLEGRKYSSTW